MKTLNAATQAELDKNNFNIVTLLAFYDIGGIDTFFTDGSIDIVYGGNTYVATRGVMGVGDITEDEDLKIEQIEIVITGVDSENVKLFLDYDYIDRRVVIYRAVIGFDNLIIGDPILVFDGRLDQPRVSEDWKARKADLAVSASSHWANFEAQSGRHTNDTEQQVLYPGDTFFEFTADTQKDVKWGKA